jgi:hypothetical protein
VKETVRRYPINCFFRGLTDNKKMNALFKNRKILNLTRQTVKETVRRYPINCFFRGLTDNKKKNALFKNRNLLNNASDRERNGQTLKEK